MRRNPLYVFKDGNSIGIFDIPLNSIVQILQTHDHKILLIELISKEGISEYSTITDLLNRPENYNILADGDLGGELALYMENNKTGYKLAGKNLKDYGPIGDHSIDFSKQHPWDPYGTVPEPTGGATGDNSFATNFLTTASGLNSTAFGYGTTASGRNSIVGGFSSKAEGDNSFAAGDMSKATGKNSIAVGYRTAATGMSSTSFGFNNTSSGDYSFTAGENNTASGSSSFVVGSSNIATANFSFAEGNSNTANGTLSHVEGFGNKTEGTASHAEGQDTIASGDFSHAEGYTTYARGPESHAEGSLTVAYAVASHAEGIKTLASHNSAHAEGYNTEAGNASAHAEGNSTKALGLASHAGGLKTLADEDFSFAMGKETQALEEASFAIGEYSRAMGPQSFAGGYNTTSENEYSFAFGYETHAYVRGSTALGYKTESTGIYSMAVGGDTYAVGSYSFASGFGTKAHSDYGAVFGMFNSPQINSVLEVGIGTTDSTRANAMVVYKDGNIKSPMLAAKDKDILDDSSLIAKSHMLAEIDEVFADVVSKLDEVREVNAAGVENRGYRIYGRPADHYGPIGLEAIDFTWSTSINSINGATGDYSFATGLNSIAYGKNSIVFNELNEARGINSAAFGKETKATATNSITFGNYTLAEAENTAAFGLNTKASQENAVAFGSSTEANGRNSIASGTNTITTGLSTLVSGDHSETHGDYSFAFGYKAITDSTASKSFAFGDETTTKAEAAFAGGFSSVAEGIGSFAFGSNSSTDVQAEYGVAMGRDSHAHAPTSFALGKGIEARSFYSMNTGKYNKGLFDTLFEVGIGNGDAARENAFEVHNTGTIYTPVMTISDIQNDANGRILVTREYLQDRGGQLALEHGFDNLTADTYIGYRLYNASMLVQEMEDTNQPQNVYSVIGQEAVDLSVPYTTAKITNIEDTTDNTKKILTIESFGQPFQFDDDKGALIVASDKQYPNINIIIEDTLYDPNTGENKITVKADTEADYDNVQVNDHVIYGEGLGLGANANYSFAAGFATTADGKYSMSVNFSTHAQGQGSFAINECTETTGTGSFAGGYHARAVGDYSFAFGQSNVVLTTLAASTSDEPLVSDINVAASDITTAIGNGSVALGRGAVSEGDDSFAHGQKTTAVGVGSFAAGYENRAEADFSYTFGHGILATNEVQFTLGKYNVGNANNIFEIGIGTDDAHRKNAFLVGYGGDAQFTGNVDIDKDLNVDGNANIDGTLDVHQDAHFYADVTIDGRVEITDDLNMNNYRITNLGDAQADGDAISRGYADDRYVNITGDTMSGALTINNDLTVNGDTKTGPLDANGDLKVNSNHTLVAPNLTISRINSGGDRSLITKEYLNDSILGLPSGAVSFFDIIYGSYEVSVDGTPDEERTNSRGETVSFFYFNEHSKTFKVSDYPYLGTAGRDLVLSLQSDIGYYLDMANPTIKRIGPYQYDVILKVDGDIVKDSQDGYGLNNSGNNSYTAASGTAVIQTTGNDIVVEVIPVLAVNKDDAAYDPDDKLYVDTGTATVVFNASMD